MATVSIYQRPSLGSIHSNDFYSWINLELYHELSIAYISNNTTHGIPRERFGECRLWMIHHLAHDIIIYTDNEHSIGRYYSLCFSSKEDLTAFTLSEWGELATEMRK